MFVSNAKKLLEKLIWEYDDISLYEQALTHSSYAHEKNKAFPHNERLEFLGDAVLELIISDYLFRKYKHLPEGELTRLRAYLVCEDSLTQLAVKLEVGKYLYLGKGEASYGGAQKPSILSDAVESIIAALYLDLGFSKCYKYVVKLFSPIFKTLEEGKLQKDFKSMLQEFAQSRFGITPVYRILEEKGPDHEKEFIAQVLIDERVVECGEGRSKREAEQEAARRAWNILSPS